MIFTMLCNQCYCQKMDLSLSCMRQLVVLLVFSSRFIILRFPMTVDTLITCLSLKKTNFTASKLHKNNVLDLHSKILRKNQPTPSSRVASLLLGSLKTTPEHPHEIFIKFVRYLNH